MAASFKSATRIIKGYCDARKTDYKGNYGNILFIWDMIFATGHITRKYPDSYGIENLQESSWQQELFWPLVSSTTNSVDKVDPE